MSSRQRFRHCGCRRRSFTRILLLSALALLPLLLLAAYQASRQPYRSLPATLLSTSPWRGLSNGEPRHSRASLASAAAFLASSSVQPAVPSLGCARHTLEVGSAVDQYGPNAWPEVPEWSGILDVNASLDDGTAAAPGPAGSCAPEVASDVPAALLERARFVPAGSPAAARRAGSAAYQAWVASLGLAPFRSTEGGGAGQLPCSAQLVPTLSASFPFRGGGGLNVTSLSCGGAPSPGCVAGAAGLPLVIVEMSDDPNIFHQLRFSSTALGVMAVVGVRFSAQFLLHSPSLLERRGVPNPGEEWMIALVSRLAPVIDLASFAGRPGGASGEALVGFPAIYTAVLGEGCQFSYDIFNFELCRGPEPEVKRLAEWLHQGRGPSGLGLAAAAAPTPAGTPPQGPYVLILQRTGLRAFVDAETGSLRTLADAMCSLGLPVRVSVFEGLSAAEQIERARGAAVLVSPHGAGLTNLVFMRPGSVVIEVTMRRGWCCSATERRDGCTLESTLAYPGCHGYHKVREREVRRETDLEKRTWKSKPATFHDLYSNSSARPG